MDEDMDIVAGFIAAACAPALLIALIALPFTGLFAFFLILPALTISMLHVILVAVPLYALINRWRTPGPGTVMVAAVLVGALPMPLLAGTGPALETWPLALCGAAGGVAFLAFAWRGRTCDRDDLPPPDVTEDGR